MREFGWLCVNKRLGFPIAWGLVGLNRMSHWIIQKPLKTIGGHKKLHCSTSFWKQKKHLSILEEWLLHLGLQWWTLFQLDDCFDSYWCLKGLPKIWAPRIYVNVLDVSSGVLYSGARVCAWDSGIFVIPWKISFDSKAHRCDLASSNRFGIGTKVAFKEMHAIKGLIQSNFSWFC